MAKIISMILDRRILAGLLLACFCLIAGGSAATDGSADGPGPPAGNNRIHIRADKLVSLRNSNYIQFTGDVDVALENTRIQSAALKVFFKQAPSGDAPATENNIEKIVANGNVRINMGNRKATSGKAVYQTDTQILVLTGKDVTISSENNSITGSQITFDQRSGEIIVDGDGGQRVNAVIHQNNGNILNPQTEEESP